MTITRSAPLLALLASLALPAHAGRYETDHDADVDFSSYETYAWHEVEPEDLEARIARSDLVVKRARRVIEEQLGKKGLRPAAPAADLDVEFHVLVRDHLDIDSAGSYRRSRELLINTEDTGTVIVDLIDTRSGKLVWRGWVRDLIRDGKTAESRIRRGLERLFREYPPEKD